MATPKLADHPGKPCKGQNTEKRVLVAVATFTDGTGTATVSGDAGISLADGGVGVFNLTYPAAADADVFIGVTVYSPADTITKAWLSALAATSGTATINTASTVGTQIDPASGDKLLICVVAQPYTY